MANEEFYVTVLALVLILAILYAFASKCSSSFTVRHLVASIKISTKTGSYKGINDLIAEYEKVYSNKGSNALYVERDEGSYAVSFVQVKNSKLSSKDVVVEYGPYTGANAFKYKNRETKKSLWNTDRPASSRLPELVALLGLHPLSSDIIVFTPGVDKNPSHYALYIATSSDDRGVRQLVELVNADMAAQTRTNLTKSPNPLPIRFYAVVNPLLGQNEVVIYENDSVTPVFKSNNRDTYDAWQLNGEARNMNDMFYAEDLNAIPEVEPKKKVDAFYKLTKLRVSLQCPAPVPVKSMYPPAESMCDEKVNHCYLLRSYEDNSSVGNCFLVPKRIDAVTKAYNEAVTSENLVHPVTKKPIRFYSGGMQSSAGVTDYQKVFATFDRSGVEISEPS